MYFEGNNLDSGWRFSNLSAGMESDTSRQQKLNKQRALMEQKKKQRQMQHGMMMAGGGVRARPTSSNMQYRMLTSFPSSTIDEKPLRATRESSFGNLHSGEAVKGSTSKAKPKHLETEISSNVTEINVKGPIANSSTTSTICPDSIDGLQSTLPSFQNRLSSSSSNTSDKYGNTSEDQLLLTPVKSKPSAASFSSSSNPYKTDSIPTQTGVPYLMDEKYLSDKKTRPQSAADKLKALGMTSSINYETESESDEDTTNDVLLPNPGAEEISVNSMSTIDQAAAPVAPKMSQATEFTHQDLKALGVVLSAEGDTIENLYQFVSKSAPDGVSVKCRVQREKRGMERSMFPTYFMYLERESSSKKLFLLAARKRKKSKCSNYLISTNASDLTRDGKYFIGKLRANFLGTSFTVYDNGIKPTSHRAFSNSSHNRQELAAIHYETNVLGFKGPRKMTTIIPAMTHDHQRIPCRPTQPSESMLERWKTNRMTDLLELHNKQPVWSDETQAFVLNFHGRVTQASVKNFQMVHSADESYIVLQFGRISDDLFTLDYNFPMSAIQAFSIALSSFDSKLACE